MLFHLKLTPEYRGKLGFVFDRLMLSLCDCLLMQRFAMRAVRYRGI